MISFYVNNPKHISILFFSLYHYPLFSLYISILFCPYQVIIPLSSHLSVLTSPTVCFRPRCTAT